MTTPSMPANNDEQIALWSGPSGHTWVAQQRRLDLQLESFGSVVMNALAVREGDVILDVGCGGGQTTGQLATLVGPSGRVTGVDISAPLLEVARATARPNVTFVQADAQTHAFAPASFSALFSRFGVMFFADPVAAFTNLAGALAPGGRLAFVCWRAPELNPVMTVPMAAAIGAGLPPPPPATNPRAPGPFAFADDAYVKDILTRAGFSSISVTPHDQLMGGNSLDDTFELAFEVGPLARMLRDHPQYKDQVVAAVRAALSAYVVDGAVLMPSATWIVTARR